MSDKAKEQANKIENEEPITVVEPDEIILENDQEPDSQETTPEQAEIEQLRQQLEEEKKKLYSVLPSLRTSAVAFSKKKPIS